MTKGVNIINVISICNTLIVFGFMTRNEPANKDNNHSHRANLLHFQYI